MPAFWCSEILNTLLVGERKGRIFADQTRAFLADLRSLKPVLDHVRSKLCSEDVQSLCRQFGLVSYDALYVELAKRSASPLATLDKNQYAAAVAIGITCL